MNIRSFFILIFFTLFVFSTASAHEDNREKKSKKSDVSCCAQKVEAKTQGVNAKQDINTKKDHSKHCSVIGGTGKKCSKEAHPLDCCEEHAKTEEGKNKAPDTKETK